MQKWATWKKVEIGRWKSGACGARIWNHLICRPSIITIGGTHGHGRSGSVRIQSLLLGNDLSLLALRLVRLMLIFLGYPQPRHNPGLPVRCQHYRYYRGFRAVL